jgi:hypothetical protein
MNPIYSIKEVINKMEHCAYQERCHTEVVEIEKPEMDSEETSVVISHLINDLH